MLEINTADPSATVYSRLFWCLLWWNMQTPSPLIPWTSPRTNQWWPRRPNQWSPAIWRGGNKKATMGQKNAQVKFTVVITIVQAVIAVFFGMFVRWQYVFSSILWFLMLLAPGEGNLEFAIFLVWSFWICFERYAPSADSAHIENRIKNPELDGILDQYPSENDSPSSCLALCLYLCHRPAIPVRTDF